MSVHDPAPRFLLLEKADRLVEILALTGPARVVDVGCGAGEFLIRVVEGSLETRAFQPLGTDYATGGQVGQDEGLTLLYAAAGSPDEWDHFEGSFAGMRYCLAYAMEPGEARDAAIERTRRWHSVA